MKDMLIEKVVEKVVEGVSFLISHINSELSRNSNVESNLGKLERTCDRIRALLDDAEERRYIEDAFVHRWLSDLKDLYMDTEDLVDEFSSLKNINDGDPKPLKRKLNTFFVNKEFARRIDKLEERRDEIDKDRKSFWFRQGESTRRIRIQIRNRNSLPLSFPQTSLPNDAPHQVHGRDTERNNLVRVLTSSYHRDVQVVSIIGCGGIGKTTLARLVFDDDTVKHHFDLRIWAGLSQVSDVSSATKKIIEFVDNKECRISSFDLLQSRLRDIVEKKRFLIVLDNVWNEELDFWWRLQAPMIGSGVEGSRVLVTTRSERVSKNMQAMPAFPLKGLSNEDCWLIFREKAFPRGDESPTLQNIGSQITKKCQGSPILVKSMASLLYSETDGDEWKCVLNDMPEHTDVSDILPALRVSYDHLPLHLKPCFSFLSIFPVGYEFDKNELVKLWMALGFVKPWGRRRVEDIGNKYFTYLLSLSFFQSSDSHHNNDRQRYKMSSLMYDLAKCVSQHEYGVISNGGSLPDGKMARYIMLAQCNQKPVSFEKVFDSRGLRSLILDGEQGLITNQILSELFEKLRYLRVLDLSNSQLEELPASVDKLILLQYLNLTGTKIKTLPESVGNLYKLQTLELRDCHQLTKLPNSIGNMKQLRYLGLYRTKIESLPESMSGLDNLQVFGTFHAQ